MNQDELKEVARKQMKTLWIEKAKTIAKAKTDEEHEEAVCSAMGVLALILSTYWDEAPSVCLGRLAGSMMFAEEQTINVFQDLVERMAQDN
jgi:hypothetical protein